MSRARRPGRSPGLRICSPPSPPTSVLPSSRRGRAPAPSAPEPGRSAECTAPRAPLGSGGGGGAGEGGAGRTARLSAGERRGLGLRLLRERQPPGRGRAAPEPPAASPPKEAARVPACARAGRAQGPCPGAPAGRSLRPQPPGLTPGSSSLSIRAGSLHVLEARSWSDPRSCWRSICGFALCW